LYGHPDSVSYWEDKCNKDVCEVGFESLGSEWPSVFYHSELKLLLTIYVDDFKLAENARIAAIQYVKRNRLSWKFGIRKMHDGWRIFRMV
jgi:hypothetical protein